MKYFVLLCDGMADIPDERGLTPMMEARKPVMDELASLGVTGMVKTVPDGMKPGSDVANLGAMGFCAQKCYTGRSPLEALSIGVKMKDGDVTYRANLVTLSSHEPFEDKIMVDYSAGEISTELSTQLIEYLKAYIDDQALTLHPGISYRHCLHRKDALTGGEFTPPHDISDKKIGEYLPKGRYGEQYDALIRRSYELLKDHPINKERIASGKNPANSIWLWGEGTKPNLPDFTKKTGLTASVISAVDLIKGIAIGSGMQVIEVEGATGNIHTNFDGKASGAINALKQSDYVYVHLEAPDECGHQGDRLGKIKSIELIDQKVLRPVMEYLRGENQPFRVLIMPDHPTPICKKTHTASPVPFIIYDSSREIKSGITAFTEQAAMQTGVFMQSGVELNQIFLK